MKKLTLLLLLLTSCGTYMKNQDTSFYEVKTENRVYFTKELDRNNSCVTFKPERKYRNHKENQEITICSEYTLIKSPENKEL